MDDAVYACLTQSKGLMVFSIVQIINYDLWNEIKKGIERSENDFGMKLLTNKIFP